MIGKMKLMVMVLVLGVLFLTGCRSTKNYLRVTDIEPKLQGLVVNGRSIEDYGVVGKNGFVEYYSIGVANYDTFFKSAAKLDGVTIIANETTKDSTAYLKKFAMSKASDEAMKDNIKELVGDTPPEKWSTEQSVAVAKMAKEKNKISNDEIKYFASTALSMGITVVAVEKGIDEVKTLLVTGKELMENVKTLDPLKAPAATQAINGSIKNLQSFSDTAPKTLKEMNVLLQAFQMLGGN